MKHLIAFFAAMLMCLAAGPDALAVFSLVEDFDSLTLGPLTGQGGWTVQSPTTADYNDNDLVDAADYVVWRENFAPGFFQLPNENGDVTPDEVTQEDYDFWKARFGLADHMVAVDPADSGNQAVAVTRGNGGTDPQAFKSLGGSIPDGSIGTVFFRIRNVSNDGLDPPLPAGDLVIGVSDQVTPVPQGAPSVFSANEGQMVFGASGDPAMGEIRLRDGAVGDNIPVGSYTPNTWYNIWMVLDNKPGATDDDKVTLYASTGTDPAALLDDGPGANPAVFRNRTADALVSVQILAGFQGPLPGYVDDFYVDTAGVNLVNPTLPPPAGLGAGNVPEPSSLVLLLMSLALLIGRGRPITKR